MNTVDVSRQKASEVPSMVDHPDDAEISEECASGEVALYTKLSKVGAIASSKGFRILGLAMTVCFLIWQGIDAEYNAAAVLCEAKPVFQAFHAMFILFFGTEALLRFSAVREKRQILKCRALIWDSTLVILLCVRVAVTSMSSSSTHKILLVVTLVQFTRQARLFKRPKKAGTGSLKVEAAKEVLRCFLLLIFVHYVVAIAMLKVTQDTEVGEEYFPNVAQGMQNLRGFLPVSDVAHALKAESKGFLIMYLANFVRCCIEVLLMVKNVLVQIRTSLRAQTQSTSSTADDNNKEIPDRV